MKFLGLLIVVDTHDMVLYNPSHDCGILRLHDTSARINETNDKVFVKIITSLFITKKFILTKITRINFI